MRLRRAEYGPFTFGCDSFRQRHDDCVYVPMDHDDLYSTFRGTVARADRVHSHRAVSPRLRTGPRRSTIRARGVRGSDSLRAPDARDEEQDVAENARSRARTGRRASQCGFSRRRRFRDSRGSCVMLVPGATRQAAGGAALSRPRRFSSGCSAICWTGCWRSKRVSRRRPATSTTSCPIAWLMS